MTFIVLWLPFLRPWWWVFVPLFLSMELKTLYLWWIAWDFAYAKTKWIVLEIIPSREVLVPLKAMEDIFAMLWNPLFDVANFREIWCEGELDNTPYWMSFEAVSIEGKLHFFARIMKQHQSILETTLYSHYPNLEIREVSDYAKNVPQNIPNEEWDLYGEEFILGREPAYPIKTYEKFFEPQGEKITAEEKRIDPINSLLEAMSKLGKGEQYWIQFILMAAGDNDEPTWRKEAEGIIGKITKRPAKKERTLLDEIIEIVYMVVFGPTKVGSGEDAGYKWVEAAKVESGEREMLLTPGEREVVTEIENKIKKPVFRTVIRGVYVAKRESWAAANRIILRSYTAHFQTINLNHFRFNTITRTKVHDIFRQRRVFLRARRMLRNAVLRFTPLFPDRKEGCILLNAEELASLFHFPVKMTGMIMPTMEKVEAKKSGPPPNLPTE